MTHVRRITPKFEKDHLSGRWQFYTVAINANAEFIFDTKVGGLTVSANFFRNFKAGKLYRVRYGAWNNGSTGYADIRLFDLQKNAAIDAYTWLHGYSVSTSRAQIPVSQKTFVATGLEILTLRIISTTGSVFLQYGPSFFEVQEL